MGSDGSAAGGGRSDQSEWQRSVGNVAALSARRTPGTATGYPPLQRVCKDKSECSLVVENILATACGGVTKKRAIFLKNFLFPAVVPKEKL